MSRVYFTVANQDKEKLIKMWGEEDIDNDSMDCENGLFTEYYEDDPAWGPVRNLIENPKCPPLTVYAAGDDNGAGVTAAAINGKYSIMPGDSEGTPTVAYRESGLDTQQLNAAELYWELKKEIDLYIEMRG